MGVVSGGVVSGGGGWLVGEGVVSGGGGVSEEGGG